MLYYVFDTMVKIRLILSLIPAFAHKVNLIQNPEPHRQFR